MCTGAVIGLFYAVGYWNAYFSILAGQAPTIGTVPGMHAPPSLAVKMAVVVIVLVPVVIIYPFIQRHFTKGVILGAVKG